MLSGSASPLAAACRDLIFDRIDDFIVPVCKSSPLYLNDRAEMKRINAKVEAIAAQTPHPRRIMVIPCSHNNEGETDDGEDEKEERELDDRKVDEVDVFEGVKCDTLHRATVLPRNFQKSKFGWQCPMQKVSSHTVEAKEQVRWNGHNCSKDM